MTGKIFEAASSALPIDSLERSLMIEWESGRDTPSRLSPASSVGRFASLDIGEGRRAGEAPHELFSSTFACRVRGCRCEFPRKSVGSLRDGHDCGNSRAVRTTTTSVVTNIDASPIGICELVNGQRPITADTALRLGMFFAMEPRSWLNLQSEYDIRVADRELRAKLAPRIRVYQPIEA